MRHSGARRHWGGAKGQLEVDVDLRGETVKWQSVWVQHAGARVPTAAVAAAMAVVVAGAVAGSRFSIVLNSRRAPTVRPVQACFRESKLD